jgi:hypothetical protein
MGTPMSTRKLIHAEVEKVEEKSLGELYRLVKGFIGEHPERSGGIMEKLLRIKIEGPEDFSRNVDAYLNGERPLADGEDPR